MVTSLWYVTVDALEPTLKFLIKLMKISTYDAQANNCFCPHIAECVNIADFVNVADFFCRKTFGDIGPPCISFIIFYNLYRWVLTQVNLYRLI